MKINIVNKLFLIAIISSISCQSTYTQKSKEIKTAKKPNIVFILTDQWRGSALGYAGNPDVKTPNLDHMANESVNFTNAVSVTPVCTPHRAALLTGKYPTTTGMFLNDLYLPEEELCMAEIFKAEGYSTAYWGKWHLDGHGRSTYIPKERRQGFDFWRGLECSHNYTKMPYYDNDNTELKYWDEYSPFAISKDANKYITEHAYDATPFLAVISIATPHYPHNSAPKEYKDLYPISKLNLPPNIPIEMEEKVREEMQGYYAHCTATDKAIGSILDKLKELNLTENTIVVFTSDHGEMLGSHGVKPFVKQLAWDESIRVPFLIKYPSIGENKGAIVNAPINTPDILPSLLGLSKIAIPIEIEGENLSELIQNPDSNADRTALVMNVAPFGGNYNDAAYRAVRTKQYTYARTPEGASMLFDNVNDPYQLNNLLNKKEFEVIQKDLDSKLNIELKKIGEDFKTRDYYLKKWNYVLDDTKHAIPYWGFDEGSGSNKGMDPSKVSVQSPKPLKN